MVQVHKTFQCERHNEIVVVVPQGDAVGFRYQDIHLESNAVIQMLDQPHVAHLVIDFGVVQLLGSIIIGSLLKFARRVSNRGGRVAFCGASPQMREVLETMNLGQLWPYCESRDEAFRTVRRG